ncbi:MAG: GNAT family N-acetyltransferase [Ginsengibacter sp.]
MTFEPLHIDEDKTKEIYANPDCQELFKSYPEYYYKTGYHPPWIGYLVIRDNMVVGVGGFIGKPKDNRVEIAYGTFKKFEGQGIASFACARLIAITKEKDPNIIITAKTSPEPNASGKVLQRNGFTFTRMVQDDGIGDAWEWVHNEESIPTLPI